MDPTLGTSQHPYPSPCNLVTLGNSWSVNIVMVTLVNIKFKEDVLEKFECVFRAHLAAEIILGCAIANLLKP